MRIALNELGGANWTGGVTYRRNLSKALKLFAPEIELFQLVSDSDKNGKQENKVINKLAAGNLVQKKINAVSKRILKTDIQIQRSLRNENIDIFFPSYLSAGKNTASIYWIPDFQFMHLPHMFSKQVVEGYNKKLPKYFENVPLVVVSSEDAQNDFKEFASAYVHKTRVMRFVAHAPKGLYDIDPKSVLSTYNLPEGFIYLPNQFWAHKNHLVVFRAMKILKEKGIRPFVVMTGNPVDVRNPMYLANILQKISEWGIRDQVALLGLIPHDHVYHLIRQSKFVLNPSLFEGWSTIVEECKSVGKRMLLSNLGVHLEQNPPQSSYFDPHDPNDLAKKLETAWNKIPSGPDLEMEAVAREALPERTKVFAQTFLSICKEAIDIIRN